MAASKAHTSDGLLDIVILKNSGSFKMLDEFVKMRGEGDNSNNDSNEYTDDGNILYTNARGGSGDLYISTNFSWSSLPFCEILNAHFINPDTVTYVLVSPIKLR